MILLIRKKSKLPGERYFKPKLYSINLKKHVRNFNPTKLSFQYLDLGAHFESTIENFIKYRIDILFFRLKNQEFRWGSYAGIFKEKNQLKKLSLLLISFAISLYKNSNMKHFLSSGYFILFIMLINSLFHQVKIILNFSLSKRIKTGMIEGYKGNTALDRPGIKCGYLILSLPVMIPKYSFQKKKFEKQGELGTFSFSNYFFPSLCNMLMNNMISVLVDIKWALPDEHDILAGNRNFQFSCLAQNITTLWIPDILSSLAKSIVFLGGEPKLIGFKNQVNVLQDDLYEWNQMGATPFKLYMSKGSSPKTIRGWKLCTGIFLVYDWCDSSELIRFGSGEFFLKKTDHDCITGSTSSTWDTSGLEFTNPIDNHDLLEFVRGFILVHQVGLVMAWCIPVWGRADAHHNCVVGWSYVQSLLDLVRNVNFVSFCRRVCPSGLIDCLNITSVSKIFKYIHVHDKPELGLRNWSLNKANVPWPPWSQVNRPTDVYNYSLLLSHFRKSFIIITRHQF
ncbi:hypothetical protein VP01_398g1 [Puccinia sorghi]|uniref:Uncharacterized protein n=1 Tax=Puccinia sorghi TaxID=27349 RepID=A0A0L6UU36_9BASI|nr:hypothetical protein VP01_398g1 [Puccinia sorghi]